MTELSVRRRGREEVEAWYHASIIKRRLSQCHHSLLGQQQCLSDWPSELSRSSLTVSYVSRRYCSRPQVNSALHPSGVAKSSTSFGWGKGGKVTSAGWQVTLCDLIWHVISRSSVVISITNCCIRFTYFTLLYCCTADSVLMARQSWDRLIHGSWILNVFSASKSGSWLICESP